MKNVRNIIDLSNQDFDISIKNIKSTISMEMIDYQKDDPFIDIMSSIIDQIRDGVRYEGKDYTVTKPIAQSIENAILDRFGINAKLYANIGILGATIPLINDEYNHLSRENGAKAIKQLEDLLKKKEGLSTTEYEIYDEYLRSVKKYDQQLWSDGVTFDNKKAKIIGLNKDIRCMLFLDFKQMMVEWNFTNREIIAIMLHEIGHMYTHIEYNYRQVQTTTILQDTFTENLANGKSPVDSFFIAYKDATNDTSVDSLRNKSKLQMTIALVDRVYRLGRQDYNWTDSEALADQFAGRFGLGKELSSSLSRVYSNYKDPVNVFFVFPFTITSITMCLFLFLILIDIPLFFLSFLFMFIANVAITSYFTYFNTHISKGQTYDDNKDRISRVRLELVRALRTNKNLNIPEIKQIINDLTSIEQDLVKLSNQIPGPFEWLYRKFFYGRNLLEMKEIDQVIEKLMENDLHVANAKLAVLKQKY